MAKKKTKAGYVTELDDDDYDRISIKSGKEGWKVASFLRWVLQALLRHDEAAEYLLDEHLKEKGRKRRTRNDDE